MLVYNKNYNASVMDRELKLNEMIAQIGDKPVCT